MMKWMRKIKIPGVTEEKGFQRMALQLDAKSMMEIENNNSVVRTYIPSI